MERGATFVFVPTTPRPWWAVLAAAIFFAAASASAEPVAITPLKQRPAFEAQIDGRKIQWRCFIRSGKEAKPVRVEQWEPGIGVDGAWDASLGTESGSASIHISTRRRRPWIEVAVTVRNEGGQRGLYEIGWKATADLKGAAYFWGGWRTPKSGGKLEADRGGKVYPLAAIYDAAECVTVAYEPEQFLSYLRHQADLSAKPASLETATRIVVDAGEQETVQFLIGAFTTRWGHQEALHYYYLAFPQYFWPLQDVDQRVWLNGGSYLVWRRWPQCDLARRMCVGWEWCYAPFRRTGDIYGRPELWDYKPVRPMAKWRDQPIDKFHEWRKRRFQAGEKCDVLMGFYVPSQIWCEERLARERYADALTQDPKAKTRFTTPWVTGHDNELRVFPLETSFGKQSREDMKAVIDELSLMAFAFDTAGGGARYYGPAAEKCVGRAWDERGVYVEEAVAIAKLIDWVHQQRQGDRRVAVIINPGPYSSYMTACRCDASMLESSPVSVASGLAQALRARLGHKPMVLWETYDYAQWLRPDLTREQYIDALGGVADWTVLACLRVAAMPAPRIALGMTPVVQWLPTICKMARAGWEPVPAAWRNDGGWVTRTGRGIGCFLATGNESATAQDIQLTVDDAWIGQGRFLWVSVGPGANKIDVRHTYRGNDKTDLTATVPARCPLVVRAIASFRKVPRDLQADVTLHGDAHEAELSVTLVGQGKCCLDLASFDMRLPKAVSLDDRPIGIQANDNGTATAEFELSGHAQLKVRYVSEVCEVSDVDLQDFPRLEGGQMNFAVQVPENPSPAIARDADWIAGYFKTYYRNAAEPRVDVDAAPVVRGGGKVKTSRVIRIVIDQSVKSAWKIRCPSADVLEIAAANEDGITRGVKQLLSIWDKRYIWAGPLPRLDMFVRAGLAGKQLPPRTFQ